MKKTISIVFILQMLSSLLFAQKIKSKRLTSNVFVAQQRTFRSELWLNNDSTYFLSLIGSYESTVNKGIWLKIKDSIILQSVSDLAQNITFQVSSSNKKQTQTTDLVFKDLFGMPIKKLDVQFISSTKDTLLLVTNDLGIISFKKIFCKKIILPKVYKTFITNTEDESHFSYELDESHNHYELTSNYPSTFFVYSLDVKSFAQEEQKLFWVKRNQLFWKQQELLYKKDIYMSLHQMRME
jgi:hypothetical protein